MSVNVRFKLTLPKKIMNIKPQTIEKDVDRLILSTAKKITTDYGKTMKTWKEKDKFKTRSVRTFGGNGVIVGTNSKRYLYLDDGTRRHYVRPRRAKRLRFQTGYFSKTSYRTIGSRRGGAFGPVAFSRGHYVSGILGRDFTDEIADQNWKKYVDGMEKVFKRRLHI